MIDLVENQCSKVLSTLSYCITNPRCGGETEPQIGDVSTFWFPGPSWTYTPYCGSWSQLTVCSKPCHGTLGYKDSLILMLLWLTIPMPSVWWYKGLNICPFWEYFKSTFFSVGNLDSTKHLLGGGACTMGKHWSKKLDLDKWVMFISLRWIICDLRFPQSGKPGISWKQEHGRNPRLAPPTVKAWNKK